MKENNNMNVEFYTKSFKPDGKDAIYKWVEIRGIYSDPEFQDKEIENHFEFTTLKAVGISPIFKKDDFGGRVTEQASEIAKLAEEQHPEVILVCDVGFFKKVVKQSEEDELNEVNVLISEDRGMMYYTKIGDDKCALLIAYDDCNDN